MNPNKIVSSEQWLVARKELLRKEKELTKHREEVTRQRQCLPWTLVEKDYQFESPDGTHTLSQLFGSFSQLIVYHFMFDPEWEEGCKSCSLIADHYNPLVVHLNARDVNLVTISRTPLQKLAAFQQRMQWTFQWVSSLNSEFNYDYNVSFTSEQIAENRTNYNYSTSQAFPLQEAPGMSCFYKDADGKIFHTYSVYARGLETFLGIYDFLDTVPKGRDEDKLNYGMEWVRHHDRYGDDTFVDPYVNLGSDE